MGIIDHLLGRSAVSWKDPRGWNEAFGTMVSASGQTISAQRALTCSAVFACVRILAETVASLPIHVFRRVGDGKERATDHPLYEILHNRPNPFMSSYSFRENLQGHQELRGNAYALIERARGRVVGLWPLHPDLVTPEKTAGTVVYRVSGDSPQVYGHQDIVHVRGLGDDGLVGYSPIRMAREAIGLSLAAQEMGARLFSNGVVPRGILESAKALTPVAREKLRDAVSQAHQGAENAHKLVVLEDGVTWKNLGVNPDEAQFLETRRFQIGEVARIFGIPPHMIGDTERSTSWGTGIEQQGIGFVVYTLRPRLVRFEAELSNKLLTPAERQEFFIEFAVDGLLRGDIKSRYASYAVGRQWGWLSVNDIRKLESMNPIEGGDVYLQPTNMVPMGTPPLSLDTPDKGEGQDEK